jgi:hypothetical protein
VQTSQELSTEQIAALVRAMAACTPTLVAASTVAIVGGRSPVVRQIGTGTLLAIADARFVVTAAHVLVQVKELGMTVGISGGHAGNFTALPGDWIVTSADAGSNDNDAHDVALYKLNDRQVDRLDGVEFVRIGDVSFSDNLSSGYFVVCGFPGMWSTVSDSDDAVMKSKLLQYGTYPFMGSTTALNGYDPRRHFLLQGTSDSTLDHNGEPTAFRTRSGHSADMPRDLGGVSGCSVWMIGDFRTPVPNWSRQSARIVGIETGVFHERGALKATRWNAVASVLHSAFPELRPVIEMYAR